MAYTSQAFNPCMFNPLVSEKMLQAYPRLSEIIAPEWAADANIDSILRYVSMMYDPKSPLVTVERDLNYRKQVAAEMAGITDEELLTTIFTFTHQYLVELVVKFLIRFVKSKEFTAIIVVESCFWESTKKLLEPIDGETSKAQLEAVQKKAAIKDELDKDIARLEKYYAAFFGDDKELEVKAKGRVTPESIAKGLR
jgi:hypothetical protein